MEIETAGPHGPPSRDKRQRHRDGQVEVGGSPSGRPTESKVAKGQRFSGCSKSTGKAQAASSEDVEMHGIETASSCGRSSSASGATEADRLDPPVGATRRAGMISGTTGGRPASKAEFSGAEHAGASEDKDLASEADPAATVGEARGAEAHGTLTSSSSSIHGDMSGVLASHTLLDPRELERRASPGDNAMPVGPGLTLRFAQGPQKRNDRTPDIPSVRPGIFLDPQTGVSTLYTGNGLFPMFLDIVAVKSHGFAESVLDRCKTEPPVVRLFGYEAASLAAQAQMEDVSQLGTGSFDVLAYEVLSPNLLCLKITFRKAIGHQRLFFMELDLPTSGAAKNVLTIRTGRFRVATKPTKVVLRHVPLDWNAARLRETWPLLNTTTGGTGTRSAMPLSYRIEEDEDVRIEDEPAGEYGLDPPGTKTVGLNFQTSSRCLGFYSKHSLSIPKLGIVVDLVPKRAANKCRSSSFAGRSRVSPSSSRSGGRTRRRTLSESGPRQFRGDSNSPAGVGGVTAPRRGDGERSGMSLRSSNRRRAALPRTRPASMSRAAARAASKAWQPQPYEAELTSNSESDVNDGSDRLIATPPELRSTVADTVASLRINSGSPRAKRPRVTSLRRPTRIPDSSLVSMERSPLPRSQSENSMTSADFPSPDAVQVAAEGQEGTPPELREPVSRWIGAPAAAVASSGSMADARDRSSLGTVAGVAAVGHRSLAGRTVSSAASSRGGSGAGAGAGSSISGGSRVGSHGGHRGAYGTLCRSRGHLDIGPYGGTTETYLPSVTPADPDYSFLPSPSMALFSRASEMAGLKGDPLSTRIFATQYWYSRGGGASTQATASDVASDAGTVRTVDGGLEPPPVVKTNSLQSLASAGGASTTSLADWHPYVDAGLCISRTSTPESFEGAIAGGMESLSVDQAQAALGRLTADETASVGDATERAVGRLHTSKRKRPGFDGETATAAFLAGSAAPPGLTGTDAWGS